MEIAVVVMIIVVYIGSGEIAFGKPDD